MFIFREGLAYFKQAYVKPQQCGKGLVTERGLSAVQTWHSLKASLIIKPKQYNKWETDGKKQRNGKRQSNEHLDKMPATPLNWS